MPGSIPPKKSSPSEDAPARSTVSGPAVPSGAGGSPLQDKVTASQELAARFAFNENKPSEYGGEAEEGRTEKPGDPLVGASHEKG